LARASLTAVQSCEIAEPRTAVFDADEDEDEDPHAATATATNVIMVAAKALITAGRAGGA
jgi:hypothetical protein